MDLCKKIGRLSAILAITVLSASLISGCGDDSPSKPEVDSSIITMAITANISYVSDSDNLFGGVIGEGDVIVGTYVYDTDIVDSNDAATVNDYRHYSAPCGIFLTTEGFSFGTDPGDVDFLLELCNNHGSSSTDNYLLRSYNNVTNQADITVTGINWQLDDDTAAALSSPVLTDMPPVLDDWTSSFGLTIEGYQTSDDSKTFMIRGHVTLISKVD